MADHSGIYLDNSATSFPKPEAVYEAVDRFNRKIGASVGRGTYRLATDVQAEVQRCRKQIAELFHVARHEQVIFTFNGTDSLNMALFGLLRNGDHVVTSVLEHNSVLRPLRTLETQRNVTTTYVEANDQGLVDPTDIRAAIQPNTKLIALIHASNVTGTIQPIEDVVAIAKQAGAFTLIDAAQTAGHVGINLGDLPIDLLALPGHKGLLGPLGTGILYIRPGLEEQIESYRLGGTGSQSEDDKQPQCLPDKYESGNHNTPALFGLSAAVTFLNEQGIDSIGRHGNDLTQQLIERFAAIPGVKVFATEVDARVPVVSIAVENMEPQIVSAILDENFDIQTRAGLHCAPGVHKCLGTLDIGGTVRFSIGPFNTSEQIEAAASAVRDIAVAG